MVWPVVKAGKVLTSDLRLDVARDRDKDHNGQEMMEEKAHVSKVRHHNVAMPHILCKRTVANSDSKMAAKKYVNNANANVTPPDSIQETCA